MSKSKSLTGALPDHELRKRNIQVRSASLHKECGIGPASIDIPCGDEFYRLPGVMQPVKGELIGDLVHRWGRLHSNSAPLEVGITYAVPLGSVSLPDNLYGYYNPKSSSGRTDVQCRVIADSVARYDTVRPEGKYGGYHGATWLLITPNSFPIVPPDNTSLVQLRVFNRDTRFDQKTLAREWKKSPLAYHGDNLKKPFRLEEFEMSDNDGTVLFTADLEGEDGLVGYCAKKTTEVLDLRLERQFKIEDFFTPVSSKNEELLFAPGQFYLLQTEQAVFVPSYLAAELVAMDERIFEGRSHYAGFIDPGFWARITLEIRCAGMLLRKGQPIARVRFERLTSNALVPYNAGVHHYKKNTFASKHFVI
ncbi:MAG: hypothetical protein A2648_01685 [Candidatus Lloydbacteria bacterium RIFCSPHIGHO2_01_FULL_41_20]|uniref:2'-deoxycytidine 5'-triphosphate deaminase n=1 Tax=Candidatus Lloydbacteria bacterium RIFCSPHIGHO2_01_FULL_41_20 TaxID=1798657 RepID=A0A1G2CSS2_9BACT|nr:MAG: hypothetical protein A2648_01685 [Candidatus Lloydbacteria bacterium RIFCSPHIGHO2_01_FULL_41_20]